MGKYTLVNLLFTKGAGFGKIKPLDFDYKMGQWLELPKHPVQYNELNFKEE